MATARQMSVFVNIGARLGSSLNATASAAERRFDRMAARMKRNAAEVKATWAATTRTMGTLGDAASRFNSHISLPAAGLVALGGRAAYSWSKVGNELQAVTQMSDTARKKIEAVARSMPGDSTRNLSMALDLARTGFSDQQIMGSLGVTMKLSRADNSVDPAEAADIMTNVMTGMRLFNDRMGAEQVGKAAERVANNIAIGAARSSSDVRLMGESFKYAAPLPARLGIEIEDLTAYFMMMADAGIKGSESGVALRSGLVRMLKPTKSAMAVMERLGMRIDDYVGSTFKPTGQTVVDSLKAQGIAADGARSAIDSLLANPNLSGAELIARISAAVGEGMSGGADAADLDKISDGVAGAIMAGATKVDFAKFLEDFTKKGGKVGDLVNFFDTRQGARLATLTDGTFERRRQEVISAAKVAAGQGTFLDKMYAVQMKGAVGPWERMMQSLGNLTIAMAESGAMDAVADGLDRIASGLMSLSKANPTLLKFGTFALMGIAAMAPLGFAAMGVGAAFRMMWLSTVPLRFALGKLIPRIVSTRTAMVAARYGWRTAAWEMVKTAAMLPVRIGSALVGRLGPTLMRGLTAIGPWLLRGLLVAIGFLATPPGWVALAAIGVGLVVHFRKEIAGAWSNHEAPFFSRAWEGLKSSVGSVEWSTLGTRAAGGIAYGLGYAWTTVSGWWSTAWTAIKDFVTTIDWGAVATSLVSSISFALSASWTAISNWWSTAWTDLKNYVTTIDWSAVGAAVGQAILSGLQSNNPVAWGKAIADKVMSGAPAVWDAAKKGWAQGQAAAGPKPLPAPRIAGKRAMGGPVVGGRLYLVGERGPELFRAPASGSIVPNGATERMLSSVGAARPILPPMPANDAVAGANVTPPQAFAERRAAGGERALSVSVGQIVVQGASDPQATARAVREEIRKLAVGQSAYLSD